MAIYTPSVDDVAALLTSRTVDANGAEVGTFNEDTRPTARQVEAIIAKAEGLLAPRLGVVPAHLRDSARSLIAVQAAILVELSYYPDQAEAPQSVVGPLQEALRDGIIAYREGAESSDSAQAVGTISVGTDLNP